VAAARACQRATRIRADSKRLRGELFRVQLPREPTSGALARRLLEEHLGADSPEQIADAKTVASELVNNAIVHGYGAIELRVSRRRGRLRIEVTDEGTDASIHSRVAATPHGLDIVDALSLAWGTREGSTHVWAELRAHSALA